jgi:hypothetical protein
LLEATLLAEAGEPDEDLRVPMVIIDARDIA